jgi:hypothetical protein
VLAIGLWDGEGVFEAMKRDKKRVSLCRKQSTAIKKRLQYHIPMCETPAKSDVAQPDAL